MQEVLVLVLVLVVEEVGITAGHDERVSWPSFHVLHSA